MSNTFGAVVDRVVPLVMLGAAGCLTSVAPSSSDGASVATAREPVAATTAAAKPAEPSSYLVWVRDAQGEASTHRIDARDGRALGSLDGVVLAVNGVAWRWEEAQLPVASEDCPAEMTLDPLEDGHATRVVLHPIGQDSRLEQEVVEPSGRADVNQLEHDVELLGSVGPYLFVQESEHAYACGAHGFWSNSFFVWDAASGKKVTFAEVSELSLLRDDAKALFDEDEDLDLEEGETPELTKLVPSWKPDGALAFGHQFTKSTAYAFSDGRWSSYTRSVVVPSRTLPKEIAPYAQAPAAVVAFAAAHPELTLGGFAAESAR
jgi:hypothetical protein